MIMPGRSNESHAVPQLDDRVVGAIGRGHKPARGTRRAVGGVVCMVDARSAGFDMRPRVRAISPFQHGRKGEEHLNGDEQTDRGLPECR
jgi:hypothetical protein